MWAINSHLASGEAGEWKGEGSGSLGLKACPAQGVRGMDVTEIPGQSSENQQRGSRLYWEYPGEPGPTLTRRLGLQQELWIFPGAPIPSQPTETPPAPTSACTAAFPTQGP